MNSLLLTARSDDVLARFGDPYALLTGPERERAARFRAAADRESFVAAHLLARTTVADLLGAAAAEVTLAQCCSRCGGAHGRPRVVEAPWLAVSWSHTRGQVAALAGTGRLGVDIETSAAPYSAALAECVLAPRELRWIRAAQDPRAAFLSLWVRKEALIKAGSLTRNELSAADLTCADGEPGGVWGRFRLDGWQHGPVTGAFALPRETGPCTVRHLSRGRTGPR